MRHGRRPSCDDRCDINLACSLCIIWILYITFDSIRCHKHHNFKNMAFDRKGCAWHFIGIYANGRYTLYIYTRNKHRNRCDVALCDTSFCASYETHKNIKDLVRSMKRIEGMGRRKMSKGHFHEKDQKR